MSDQVILALITALPPTLVALFGLILGIINRTKIQEIHVATNSMKDALVKVTRSDALQEGHAEGVRAEKAAHADKVQGL